MISLMKKKTLYVFFCVLALFVIILNTMEMEKGLMRCYEYFSEQMEDDLIKIPTKIDERINNIDDKEVNIKEVKVKPFDTLRRTKRGHCFIGEDEGVRYCVKVDNDDICKSNEYHESREVCKHPELRY